MIFTVRVPFDTNADMLYVERISLWCTQQRIQLRMTQLLHKADLQFSGEGKAITDLKEYLEKRKQYV